MHSTDLEDARALVSQVYYPHRIDFVGPAVTLAMQMNVVQVGPFTLGTLNYDADVRLDFGELETSYHVNVPLSGHLDAACGNQAVMATPTTAAMFTPKGRTILRLLSADCTVLTLKIDRKDLETELQSLIGAESIPSIDFDLALDLTSATGRSWLEALGLLASELERPGGIATQPLVAAPLRRVITSGLLLAAKHNYSAVLHAPCAPARPRAVKRAIDLMESLPEQPWSVPDLAKAAGVSVRSLEEGFRRNVGVPPTTYLRNIRLERVHAELTASDLQCAVTEVALRWGFAHLGRFAAAYQQRYGILPSQTLRG